MQCAIDQDRHVQCNQIVASKRRSERFEENERFQWNDIIRSPTWNVGPRTIGRYALAGFQIVSMFATICRQQRQIWFRSCHDECHGTTERIARHSDPVGIDMSGKTLVCGGGLERATCLSRPSDERSRRIWVVRRDDDKSFARQTQYQIMMHQRGPRSASISLREQNNGKNAIRRDRTIFARPEFERALYQLGLGCRRRISNQDVERGLARYA